MSGMALAARPRAALDIKTVLERFYQPGFHRQMLAVSGGVLLFSFVGCRLTGVTIPDPMDSWIAVCLAVAATIPLPLYWHEKGKYALRDAALTLPWALIFAVLLPFPVSVAGRLGSPMRLQDGRFQAMDHALGVNVAAIAQWGSHHWLGGLADWSYPLLIPLIPFSFLLPAILGKVKQAQEFLTGNLFAFAIGLPLFALLPAVGPWYGYGFAARPEQAACQAGLFLMRNPHLYLFHPDGVVCFPSFHVIWAILCARSLWGIRYLRLPAILFSGLIILSTLTTAWHYFVDVLGGVCVAAVAISFSSWLYRRNSV